MRIAPPVLPGSKVVTESPVDRALSLLLAEERDAALRWAIALVKHDPSMPTALALTGRLLGELGRHELAREALTVAVQRAIDFENLPLAVTAANELARLGGSEAPSLRAIARAFCKGSPLAGDGALPPPPMPKVDEVQPLPSVITGALLLGKATEAVHEAKRKLEEEAYRPPVRALPFYSSIDEEGLFALLEAFTPQWVPQDRVVVAQGTPGETAYFVARGELEVRRERAGETLTLGRLTNGSIFGEMAVLSRAPRSGSVVAVRPSIVLEISRDTLDKLARAFPELGRELAAYTKERMVQNLLRMSEVLRVVPQADRPALVARFQPRVFEPNERLHAQDELPEGIFLIASGEVAVVRREGDEGEPLVLATLGPGDVAGEVSVVLRRRANADVIATHPTVTLFLPTTDFMGLIDEHPSILGSLYRLAVRRAEETQAIEDEGAMIADDFDLV